MVSIRMWSVVLLCFQIGLIQCQEVEEESRRAEEEIPEEYNFGVIELTTQEYNYVDLEFTTEDNNSGYYDLLIEDYTFEGIL